MGKPKRKFVDWDSIEPLYRAGSMSLNDICRQYAADHQNSTVWKIEVKHNTISEHAKRKKWVKNLASKVKDRIQEKLTTGLTTACRQSDEDTIEAAAAEPVKVALGQRARTASLLQIQDDLAIELRGAENTDIMSRVRGFKDIAQSVRSLQDQQAIQYKLNEQTSKDKTRIKVKRSDALE